MILLPLAFIVEALWAIATWAGPTIALAIGMYYLGQALSGQDLPEAEAPEDASGRMWNPRTTQQEGLPRPRDYGRNMHHGNVIAKWTDVDGNDREILYLLLEHGDGPTKGNVADQIWLNNQPVGNFGSVVVQERVGTTDQTVMTGFEKPKLEYPENAELTKDDAYMWTTPNTFFDDIEWTICFPNGLARWKKSGSRRTTTVHFDQRIREHPAGGWSDLGGIDITAGVTTPYFKKYTASGQGFTCTRGKQYDIEITKTAADSGERLVTDSFLRSFREVVDIAFTHPGKALTGIKAIATTKLSGGLDIKIIREDRLINVWNGTVWNIEYSRNRAWIAYDVLTQPVISGSSPYVIERYEGIDPSNLDLDFFYSWADFCSDPVDDGYGGSEDRIACDIKIDYQTDVWSIVHDIAQVGRAYLYWKGTMLTGWIDKVVATPTDLVTMDTIMARTWKNHWVNHDELAGSVTIFYRDKNQGYERVPATKSKAAAGSYKRTISIEGTGITTYGTAIHVANHALERNSLIRNINSFKQFKDGFRHELGEVIRLQHRRPDWGASYRVVKYIDNNTIKLDRVFTASAGDIVYVRSYDAGGEAVELDAYTVASVSGAELTIAETWDVDPVKNNVVAIGVAGAIKLRRIIKIEPDVSNYFDVTVETYDAALYDADDLDPEAPNKDYIWLHPAGAIEKHVSHEEVVDLANKILPPSTDFDELKTSNLKWNNETPDGDSISWTAEDGETPILVTVKGVSYDITADDTNKRYIYWDENFSTTLQSTDLVSGAIGAGKYPLCFNYDGLADPAWGSRIIGTYKVNDNAISDGASAYAEGNVGLLLLTWSNMLTLTFESLGNPIYINCSAILKAVTDNNGAKVCIQRKLNDELPWVTVWDGQADIWLETDYAQLVTPVIEDSPAAGTYKYYFRGQKTLNAGRAVLAYNRSIYIQELKK